MREHLKFCFNLTDFYPSPKNGLFRETHNGRLRADTKKLVRSENFQRQLKAMD